ncbi:MAG: hypothetical protein LBQ80_03005 [Clostridium sp.]|jgi:hypothetical protein|nr:hypothetical protein [Clostridium sp.]
MKLFRHFCVALALFVALSLLLAQGAAALAQTGQTPTEDTLTASENARALMLVFDSYLEQDTALNTGISFVAIDPQNLPDLSARDRELMTAHYAKSLGVQLIWMGIGGLKEQGLFDDELQSIPNGLLLSLDKKPVVLGVLMSVSGSKYRGACGANGFESSLVHSDGSWTLLKTKMTWIS